MERISVQVFFEKRDGGWQCWMESLDAWGEGDTPLEAFRLLAEDLDEGQIEVHLPEDEEEGEDEDE